MTATVTYEVNLQVDAAIEGDYRAWLDGHDLAEDAPRMRETGLARFGGRFRATRRVLQATG